MKIKFHGISEVFDTDNELINSIVIENQSLLTDICMDIYNQTSGLEGKTVVSDNDKPLDMGKHVEILMQFIPFDLNKKSLLNKIISRAETIANEPDYYESTVAEMAGLENYLWKIVENMEGNIFFSKLSIASIIKAVGMEFEEDYKSLGEKIIDYMELVREYDRDKLFIFVNLRSYIEDNEFIEFLDTISRKQFHAIIIESCERTLCSKEKRFIVDCDYCEIV